MLEVFIGWDDKEIPAWKVAAWSMWRHSSIPLRIRPIQLERVKADGLFWRNMYMKGDRWFDEISGAPCSTAFALTRFLVPHLMSDDAEWGLFCDCDMTFVGDMAEVAAMLDPKYAIMCTKHTHVPKEFEKMNNQVQLLYSRKNWSSFCAFNKKHPSNSVLTLDYINSQPGRVLHAFSWLKDSEIGPIPLSWNHLVGYDAPDAPEYKYLKVNNFHHTEGSPCLKGYENCQDSGVFWKEHEIIKSMPGIICK